MLHIHICSQGLTLWHRNLDWRKQSSVYRAVAAEPQVSLSFLNLVLLSGNALNFFHNASLKMLDFCLFVLWQFPKAANNPFAICSPCMRSHAYHPHGDQTSPALTPCISHLLFEGQLSFFFSSTVVSSSQHLSCLQKSISIGNQGYSSFFCGLSFSLHDWV